MTGLNETHRQSLTSWLESATGETEFPIQNLPFGRFSSGADMTTGVGVAIGDQIVDLSALCDAGLVDSLSPEVRAACQSTNLDALAALGSGAWSAVRAVVSQLLSDDRERQAVEKCLVPMAAATLCVPTSVRDYTDFYASVYHATNIGKLFRPDNPLLPNYKHIPIGYHGRASSVIASGTPFHRPSGQRKAPSDDAPSFGPSRLLDYELEVGFYIGPGNPLGSPIDVAHAEEHIFGLCLLNDWSARDIQGWEYQPLGPFLGKSFATTVSPWVVTLEALAPFRAPEFERPDGDPQPLSYLTEGADPLQAGFDVTLEVFLETESMRAGDFSPHLLSCGSLRDIYWTLAQMVTHHSSNGCNLNPGDLMATGTVSGASEESLGSLMEITRRGSEPLKLPNGEERAFLEDGDELILRGRCERSGFQSIGFGECRGRVLPARSSS